VRRDVKGRDPRQEIGDARALERERIVAGITKAAIERGHATLTLDEILRHSGVSREIFESHFETTEQGVIVAHDAFFDRLALEVSSSCQADLAWIDNLRAGLDAGLAYLEEASALARVFAVEAPASSLAISERQFAALDRFASLLGEWRRQNPAIAELPQITERLLVGGIASLVTPRLLSEDLRGLGDLEPQLTELILAVYLGRDEARRIARG
jgi:AcrR family transcriptional regulator